MASTQKIILLILILNVLIGILPAISETSTEARMTYGTDYMNNLGEDTTTNGALGSQEDFFQTADSGADWGTVVNTAKLAKTFLGVFTIGLIPFGPTYYAVRNDATVLEALIIIMLDIFRSFLYILVGLEAYLLFVNKKTGG